MNYIAEIDFGDRTITGTVESFNVTTSLDTAPQQEMVIIGEDGIRIKITLINTGVPLPDILFRYNIPEEEERVDNWRERIERG
jgi:hypothetical protein